MLLFCSCCFICRSYSYIDCLFSFYARPYVFTFYVTFILVTVCECHVELKATWLDLTHSSHWLWLTDLPLQDSAGYSRRVTVNAIFLMIGSNMTVFRSTLCLVLECGFRVGGSNCTISGSIKSKMAAMTWHDRSRTMLSFAKLLWSLFLSRRSQVRRSRPSVRGYGPRGTVHCSRHSLLSLYTRLNLVSFLPCSSCDISWQIYLIRSLPNHLSCLFIIK